MFVGVLHTFSVTIHKHTGDFTVFTRTIEWPPDFLFFFKLVLRLPRDGNASLYCTEYSKNLIIILMKPLQLVVCSSHIFRSINWSDATGRIAQNRQQYLHSLAVVCHSLCSNQLP